MEKHEEVLNFWFGNIVNEESPPDEKYKLWFEKNDLMDKEIRDLFLHDVEAALNNFYDSWQERPESALALIILLDQFPRNIFRNTPRAFEGDMSALQVALISVDRGYDKLFHPTKRVFFYLPFEHSENVELQNKSIELFTSLLEEAPNELKEKFVGFLDYAEKHKAVIDKFDRFPHRNHILARESTPEEIEFLKQPNSSF